MKCANTVAIVTLGAVLVSCNESQLPAGAKVTTIPMSKSFNMGEIDPSTSVYCLIGPETIYQDVPVNINVTDSQGVPMGGVEVSVYADFSGNTFSGPDVLQVYADYNSNGVIDEKTELVSGSQSGIYLAKTGRYDGTTMVFVRMNLTCPYQGELLVFAGDSASRVGFEVTYTTKQL